MKTTHATHTYAYTPATSLCFDRRRRGGWGVTTTCQGVLRSQCSLGNLTSNTPRLSKQIPRTLMPGYQVTWLHRRADMHSTIYAHCGKYALCLQVTNKADFKIWKENLWNMKNHISQINDLLPSRIQFSHFTQKCTTLPAPTSLFLNYRHEFQVIKFLECFLVSKNPNSLCFFVCQLVNEGTPISYAWIWLERNVSYAVHHMFRKRI